MSIISSIPRFHTTGLFGLSSAEGSTSSIHSSDDSTSPVEGIHTVSQPVMSLSSVIRHHRSIQQPFISNYLNHQSSPNSNLDLNENPRQIEDLLMLTNSLLFKQFRLPPPRDEVEYQNSNAYSNGPSRPCRICQIEAAKVSHFGVHVCTGCRAFFRRSVAQQKTYTCLNSRLCGSDKLVPNRRVCKFCRFQRCVAAGMLKGKEQMQMQHLEETLLLNKRNGVFNSANTNLTPRNSVIQSQQFQFQSAQPNPEILSPHEYSITVDLSKNVVEQFMVTRRKITYERMQLYYDKPIQLEEFRKNVAVYLQENELLNRNFISKTAPFNEFSSDDQNSIFTEYSICWMVSETIWATIRKDGHHSNRNYYVDGRYIQLNEDHAMRHWGSVFEDLFCDRDPTGLVKQSLVNYFLATAIFYNRDCACEFANAGLSDEEGSALFLLVCTRQEVLGRVSKKSADALRKMREKVLRYLGVYLESTGQNVPKRIDQIIALITPVQEAVCLWKRCSTLLYKAISLANLEPDEVCPDYSKYFGLVEKVEHYIQNLHITDAEG